MPVCLYLRGCPGTGKDEVSRVLMRDLGWPRIWVHDFDGVYAAIGEYKVPRLTDQLIQVTASHLVRGGKDFMVVRPSRDTVLVNKLFCKTFVAAHECSPWTAYTFVLVRLTAPYATLAQRVTRRWHESPFRITTREALDEYLSARPEEEFPGEYVIDTSSLTPEQVAGRIKELLP